MDFGVSAAVSAMNSGVSSAVMSGATGVGLGAAIGLGAPYVAGMLVPSAMTYFGVVVPGVGTLHVAGGVAATLQYLSTTSMITSGAIGACASVLGKIIKK